MNAAHRADDPRPPAQASRAQERLPRARVAAEREQVALRHAREAAQSDADGLDRLRVADPTWRGPLVARKPERRDDVLFVALLLVIMGVGALTVLGVVVLLDWT